MSEVLCNCINSLLCTHAKPVIPAPPLPCACGKLIMCTSSTPCSNLAGGQPLPTLGPTAIRSVEDLFAILMKCGGAIVNANSCTAYQIAEARSEGRIYIDTQGYGFVLLTPDWLNNVRKLEKLHP